MACKDEDHIKLSKKVKKDIVKGWHDIINKEQDKVLQELIIKKGIIFDDFIEVTMVFIISFTIDQISRLSFEDEQCKANMYANFILNLGQALGLKMPDLDEILKSNDAIH